MNYSRCMCEGYVSVSVRDPEFGGIKRNFYLDGSFIEPGSINQDQ